MHSELGGVNHDTPEFAVHAGGEGGDRAALDGAKALAMTVADLWCASGALDEVRSAFADPSAS